jgi:hypothetical protein
MPKMPQFPKISLKGTTIVVILAAILVIVFLSTSFIIVDQTENAVITTFGKYTKTLGAGLHYKLPFGIQKAFLVQTKVIQTETFGFRTLKAGKITQYSDKTFPDESTMLTGDLNIVDVEWIIQYEGLALQRCRPKQHNTRHLTVRYKPSRGRQNHTRRHRRRPADHPGQCRRSHEPDIQ